MKIHKFYLFSQKNIVKNQMYILNSMHVPFTFIDLLKT